MKLVLITLLFYAVTSQACANNAMFELCMKTAKSAITACEHSALVSCACSAQKQLLACYSECAGDDHAFELEEKQLARVRQECSVPGAEREAKKDKDTEDDDDDDDDDEETNQLLHAATVSSPESALPMPIHINDSELGKSHASAAANRQADQAESDSADSSQSSRAATTLPPFSAFLLGALFLGGLCVHVA